MNSDLAEIERVLEIYFDGLYEASTEKLAQAFHPGSHLYHIGPDGKAIVRTRTEWLKGWEGRPSAQSKGSERRDRIVTIDISGPRTAFAKVECQLPPLYFIDYLTLLKEDDRWQVVAKAFHTDNRP